ncbi:MULTISPECIES: GNAT family N-acetyltransferase [Caulobacter]|jgi:RimJ/RimL family protein N-acetyltransferase|uniref:Acetyltransferase, ribosomal protein N-acetylase n=1 Tax=Caulobacter vibrioides OR37 TaxID=1292034 RepID=R0E7G6_CAUVI|nr:MULTISPECIES: GNAT family N-acetyltransferase [Caulobacter]ENZ81448.1 acetyltransferase, ribosomal protein N-acetylase [Caulobacter vibrioides OR37]
MTIELRTARLRLRPPVEGDLDGWAAFDADPQAMRFFGGPKSRDIAWDGLALAAGMWALRGCGLFSVFEAESGRWVGRVGPWVPEGPERAEVGWAILPVFWGRGYATEAAAAAVDWTFAHLGWTEARHRIDPGNSASIAVAQRIGSRWMRTETSPDGQAVEIYGQLRRDA